MTENDYIAEYIKEKHESLLGVDFAVWKVFRIAANLVRQIVDIAKQIPADQMEAFMEATKAAGNPETDEDEEIEEDDEETQE